MAANSAHLQGRPETPASSLPRSDPQLMMGGVGGRICHMGQGRGVLCAVSLRIPQGCALATHGVTPASTQLPSLPSHSPTPTTTAWDHPPPPPRVKHVPVCKWENSQSGEQKSNSDAAVARAVCRDFPPPPSPERPGAASRVCARGRRNTQVDSFGLSRGTEAAGWSRIEICYKESAHAVTEAGKSQDLRSAN